MQTTNQKGIVKLTKAQYNTLITTGSVTDGSGQTFTYQDGYLYVTDEVEYVSFTEAQVLTPEQQAQARANIGAGSGSGGTEVYVNSVLQSTLSFDSDPQTQISAKVPNTRTIAGVDLQDNITKNELLTALNVEDGAEVNEVNDVEIDDVSCVTGTTAEIRTINGDYNASTNRLATASDISDKVDETNTASQVYGTDTNGGQTTYGVANSSSTGDALALYDSSGRLKSATPSADDDVANKSFVVADKTTLTSLYSGNTSNGATINLSQSMDNFSYIAFSYCGTDNCWSTMIWNKYYLRAYTNRDYALNRTGHEVKFEVTSMSKLKILSYVSTTWFMVQGIK